MNAENTQLRVQVNAARAEFDDDEESACEEDEADDEHVSASRPLGKSL
jgi:hypothetical protein